MRHIVRVAMLGALANVALFVTALTPAAQASFGVTEEGSFEASTCVNTSCTYASVQKNEAEAFTQAAGHPPAGITSFQLNSKAGLLPGQREPEGALRRLRTDVAAGLAANPQALPKCSLADFDANKCAGNTEVGEDKLTIFEAVGNLELTGTVYNLEQPSGLPLEFGIHVEIPEIADEHILLEGHVSYSKEPSLEARGIPSGDYHEYFEINNISKTVAVLKTKLIFKGQAGAGNFLTLPSVCSSSATSYLEVESYAGEISTAITHTPVGVEGCDNVPFAPTTQVRPETATSDQPDGATTVVTVPQNAKTTNTADIKDVHVTLPEGLTLDPSAAHGLEACPALPCQAEHPASKVGTVTIETDLPPKSLTGAVYLGDPGGGPITKPPYTIYLEASSVYGVTVSLQGTVNPNPSTGRLEVTFTNNPQLPFSELILSLNTGARAPLANPLSCGSALTESLFSPYTTGVLKTLEPTPFVTTGCPNPLPFALTQSTQSANTTAGAYSPYTFNLNRADGQQYLSQVSTTLPAGLLGAIPSVPLCGEPQAAAGSCSAASQIGVASVTAGAGSEPYPLSGPVYLTGPYDGAPYGLSIPVSVIAGPFNLGVVTTRATIKVDPNTSRVIVASTNLPTIVAGVPVRLKTLKVEVNRPSFIFNPTNCGALATESTLTGLTTFGGAATATENLSTPFQVGACSALPFKPTFKAATNAKTSKKEGASLQVNITQPAHQANMKSVFVELPKQLPSRLTTLQKACPEATFAANPVNCRALGSEVGSAVVTTPVLPDQLKGAAYLVSHGGEAFPDLDLVLEGDNGVKVILVGNTKITKGVTSSNFASIPDVPVSSVALSLPIGLHSALTAIGGLCLKPLLMPTTITPQNGGAPIKQSTRISVSGCGVRILSHRVVRHTLFLKVRTLGAGKVVLTGKGLRGASRRVSKSATVTFKIPLSSTGSKTLRKHRRLKVLVRVGFTPKQRGGFASAVSTTVKFKLK